MKSILKGSVNNVLLLQMQQEGNKFAFSCD